MKKMYVLTGVIFSCMVCLAQEKPAATKKIPPKVNIKKFVPPTITPDTPKTRKVKFRPPVIKKDS